MEPWIKNCGYCFEIGHCFLKTLELQKFSTLNYCKMVRSSLNVVVLCTAVVVGNMTEESDPVVEPSVTPSSGDGEKLSDVSNDAIYPVMPVDGATPVGHRTQLNGTGHGGSFNSCNINLCTSLLCCL